MKNILTLIVFLMLSGLVKAVDPDSTNSSAIPSVLVKDLNGQSVNFPDAFTKGQITVISFWATWCKPCLVELGNIDNVYSDWKEKYNVKLIAVSVDDSRTIPKVKPMVTSKNWEYDVLIDANGDLRRAMNVTNPPTTFLIDQNGQIVYTHTGYLEGDEIELEKKIAALVKH